MYSINDLIKSEYIDITNRFIGLKGRGLTSLDGIEKFPHLQQLDVDNNQIQTLEPLKNISSLEFLSIENNIIESLEGIEVLYSLKRLYASFNLIHDIEIIKYLQNLRDLELFNNYITNIESIFYLNNLEHLIIDKNPIDYNNSDLLKFKNMVNLKTLELDGKLNTFKDLEFILYLPDLKEIYLYSISSFLNNLFNNFDVFNKAGCDIMVNQTNMKEFKNIVNKKLRLNKIKFIKEI